MRVNCCDRKLNTTSYPVSLAISDILLGLRKEKKNLSDLRPSAQSNHTEPCFLSLLPYRDVAHVGGAWARSRTLRSYSTLPRLYGSIDPSISAQFFLPVRSDIFFFLLKWSYLSCLMEALFPLFQAASKTS